MRLQLVIFQRQNKLAVRKQHPFELWSPNNYNSTVRYNSLVLIAIHNLLHRFPIISYEFYCYLVVSIGYLSALFQGKRVQ